jgi:hypothetical protein
VDLGFANSTAVVVGVGSPGSTSSELAPVDAFLASRRNSYMTGANVNVDDGSDFI